jgi:hypothetical protein
MKRNRAIWVLSMQRVLYLGKLMSTAEAHELRVEVQVGTAIEFKPVTPPSHMIARAARNPTLDLLSNSSMGRTWEAAPSDWEEWRLFPLHCLRQKLIQLLEIVQTAIMILALEGSAGRQKSMECICSVAGQLPGC